MKNSFAVWVSELLKEMTEEEKFTNTVYLLSYYPIVFHICAAAFAVIELIAIFTGNLVCIIFFAVCVLLTEFCAWMCRRHKVVIEGDVLHLTPMIGRSRTIRFSDLTSFKEIPKIGVKLYVRTKKVCTVSCDCVGYKEFLQMLKNRVIQN